MTGWPDPHADGRPPSDDEYSRVTDPGKWRIISARVDEWLAGFEREGVAVVDRSVGDVTWASDAGLPVLTSTDVVRPVAAGALTMVIGRTRYQGLDDVGVAIGVGEVPVQVGLFPMCGCDACDSGSQAELDALDSLIGDIVSGAFRRLSRGDAVIITRGDGGWSASGLSAIDVRAVLRSPEGWDELRGAPWS